MTWNTVNVLGISCAGNTAMKLAWEILNVFAMYRMGFWWVLYPFPCNALAVYLLGTPALAPSVNQSRDSNRITLLLLARRTTTL